MPLDKPLTSITEADLLALIENKEAEKKTIDYKKGLFIDSDAPRDEFRADITSFANAIGGHIVIGMEEADGFPTKLCGHDIPNLERFKLRIDEILQTKVSPRVPSYGIQPILLSDGSGKYATVIQIGRSFVKPHQIAVNKDDFQFWARNSAGKYRLTVDELRTIILRSDAAADSVRRFRLDRIASVIADDTPVPIMAGARVILHLIPLSAFDAGARYNLARMQDREWRDLTCTLLDDDGSSPPRSKHNLDGYVAYHSNRDGEPNWSYVQIFRNGIIEAGDAYWLRQDENLGVSAPSWIWAVEKALYISVQRGLRLQEKLGVPTPVAVLLTIVGGANCTIYQDARTRLYALGASAFGKDVVSIPESLVDDYSADLEQVMKPILDSVWNVGGYAACKHYDSDGKFIANPYA